MESMRDILHALPQLAHRRRSADALPQALAAALAWKLAAGAELAERAVFRDCRGGVLLLETSDAVTRAQIASVSAELLSALNRMLPDGQEGAVCRRIQFLP